MALPVYRNPNPAFAQKLMLDISQAQRKLPPEGDTDWQKFLEFGNPPVEAVWIRDGISWGYEDPWFREFQNALDTRGIPCAPYHVLYPSQPAADQWRKKRSIVSLDNLRRRRASFWDVEVTNGESRAMVTEKARQVCDMEAQETGKPSIIYTRPYFVQDSMEWDAPWYDNVYWVFALYTWSGAERNPGDIYEVLRERGMSQVGIPAGRVIAVQTAKMGNGKGFGFQSNALDYDRWMLDAAAFDALWGITPVPPPPPTAPTVEATLADHERRITTLEDHA
jgi:hypothetical protein